MRKLVKFKMEARHWTMIQGTCWRQVKIRAERYYNTQREKGLYLCSVILQVVLNSKSKLSFQITRLMHTKAFSFAKFRHLSIH